MRSFLALAFLCASSAVSARAQQLMTTFTGSVGDEYGAAIRIVSDQNADGYLDVVIGAPGWNTDRGYIRCISGQYLKNGTGPVVLWTFYASVPGARFGSQIIEVASVVGDSTRDLVVSIPDNKGGGGSATTGGLYVVDGATHLISGYLYGLSNTRLGASIADVGDQDGDGKPEIAATAPSLNGSPSLVHVVNGTAWAFGGSVALMPGFSFNPTGSNVFGDVVAGGFDLDGDGRKDLAVGSPRMFGGGAVHVVRADPSALPIASYLGANAGERMGASIDFVPDVDGDAVPDFIFGAPGMLSSAGSEVGRAVVVSGKRMRFGPFPMEVYDLRFSSSAGAFHFGGCVRGGSDLNRDGVADILVGAPDYFTAIPILGGGTLLQPDRGAVIAFSGRTGQRMGFLAGGVHDNLGDCLQGGFLDIDGDSFLEFGVGAPRSDNSNTDCGNFRIYRLFPSVWTTYCTAKVNSQGCTPSISGSGILSATPGSTFTVVCGAVLNKTNGLLIYAHAPNATPFQGGTLCVGFPLTRTDVQNSGGSASGVDCTGFFSYDFAARVHSGIDPTLAVGSEVFCQYWSRDSASPSTTSLSNGVRFLVNP